MSMLRRIDCAEADDRAAFFVLGALDQREAAEVREHLDTCPEAHPEFRELGGVVPYLAELVEPVEAGPELKQRVMAMIAADVRAQTRDDDAAAKLVAAFGTPPVGEVSPAAPPGSTRLWVDEAPIPTGARVSPPPGDPRPRRGGTLRWLLPAAAVLLIAVLGAWNLSLLQQARDADRRASELRTAVAVSADPASRVARLSGTGAAPGAGGYAAFRSDGTAVMVVEGLSPAPEGRTYQAWYLGSDKPRSAGIVRVDDDGLVLVTGLRADGDIQGMALTVEPAGGVDAPTGDPIVAGRFGS